MGLAHFCMACNITRVHKRQEDTSSYQNHKLRQQYKPNHHKLCIATTRKIEVQLESFQTLHRETPNTDGSGGMFQMDQIWQVTSYGDHAGWAEVFVG